MYARTLTKGSISTLLTLAVLVPFSIAPKGEFTIETEEISPFHQSKQTLISQRSITAKSRPKVSQRHTSSPLLAVVNQNDIHRPHRIIADQVLRALESPCLSRLEHLYVRYDHPEHRGLAGPHTIILDGSVPDSEFRALLIHEFAHTMDLGCMVGTEEGGPSNFRDGDDVIAQNDPSVLFYGISWKDAVTKLPETHGADFVSGYAASDPFEDLAESVTYFVLQNDAFRLRARENTALAAKFRWIETSLFPRTIDIATGNHQWNGIVPWDTTKLPYTWHPWGTFTALKAPDGI